MAINQKERRLKIKKRIRKKIRGYSEKPRLSVFRSNKHIYAHIVDDSKGGPIVGASSRVKSIDEKGNLNGTDQAKEVGKLIAERAMNKGVTKVVFDRNGYLYHGRVKALAESARESGLNF